MRIKSQTTFVAAMLLALGVLMLAMPAGMIYGFSKDGPVPTGVWIVGAIFAPLGLLLAYLSLQRLAQRVRFGGWEVECPDGGGHLGQPLEVKLLPPLVVTPRPATLHPRMGLPLTLPLPQFGLASARGRKANVEWKLSVKIPADGTTHDMEFEIPINGVGTRPPDAAESIEEETERRERADKYRQAMHAGPDKTAAP